MYVDVQHSCSFYASKELAAATATHLFCQELVQKPRQRLRPHEALLSSFTAARLKEQQMHFMSDNKTRQKTWREQAGALQALAKLTAQTHPDNAFLLFLEGGNYVETIQEAPAKLKGIFEDPAWVQHVLQRIQTANMSATHNNSTDVAEAHARPSCRCKRTAETQHADTDEISVQPPQRRQRRRVVPAFVIASWDSSVVSSKAADRSSSLLCATHSRVMGTAWLQHCLQQAGGTKSSAGEASS
ncbi:TPA: hypothetical protein ACH3X1_008324 [Trebouxia sp. C0004]